MFRPRTALLITLAALAVLVAGVAFRWSSAIVGTASLLAAVGNIAFALSVIVEEI